MCHTQHHCTFPLSTAPSLPPLLSPTLCLSLCLPWSCTLPPLCNLTWTGGRAQENEHSAETAALVERLYAEGAEKYFEVNDALSNFEVGEGETRERPCVNCTSESETVCQRLL